MVLELSPLDEAAGAEEAVVLLDNGERVRLSVSFLAPEKPAQVACARRWTVCCWTVRCCAGGRCAADGVLLCRMGVA